MNFAYWNTKQIDAVDMIVDIIKQNNLSLFFLSEINLEKLLEQINKIDDIGYEVFENPGCERVLILKKKNLCVQLNIQNHFYSAIKLIENDIYVISLHLPSQMFQSLDSLKEFMRDLRNNIDVEIGDSLTEKILLIGDFNINPYESPMTHYDGFLATNSPMAKNRINHLQKSRTTYYNPTWQLYSRKNFPGTKQFRRPSATSYDILEFHFLDQVIISQKLLESISEEKIEVVEKTDNFEFFNVKTNKIKQSDHLPLLYKLKLNIS